MMESPVKKALLGQYIYTPPNPPPEPPEMNDDVSSDFVKACLEMESEGDGMLYDRLFRGKVLFSVKGDKGQWYVYDRHRWSPDNIFVYKGLVGDVAERYGAEIDPLQDKIKEINKQGGGALFNDDDDSEDIPEVKTMKRKKKALYGQVKKYKSRVAFLRKPAGRNACIDMATTHKKNNIINNGEGFDLNPMLLGVPNGVVDLESGLLMTGTPEMMISQQTAARYITEIDKTDWLKFLSDIYNGDQDVIHFMQILLGYSCTGLVSDHIFPFLLGSGRNGKSLLVESIIRVLGDYGIVIPSYVYLKQRKPAGGLEPEIAALYKKRFAISSEVPEGAAFSSEQVKRLNGGDRIACKDLYVGQLVFEPTHKSFILGNHEPIAPAGDSAFWERAFLVTHPVHFTDDPQGPLDKPKDRFIGEKLKKMDEQILAWMIEGTGMWLKEGINPPASVLKDTGDYENEADFIGNFLSACCDLSKASSRTSAADLYAAFSIWYGENLNKRSVPSVRAFGMKLKRRPELIKKMINGTVNYQGVMLKGEWDSRVMDAAMPNRARM